MVQSTDKPVSCCPQAHHRSVAVLDQGGVIAGGLRLAVTRLGGSEIVNLYETEH